MCKVLKSHGSVRFSLISPITMIVAFVLVVSLLIGSQRAGTPVPAKAPVATVHGHVISRESGAGVAGVSVWLLSDIFAEDGFPESRRIAGAISDENGEYRLAVPAAGQYSVIG